MTNDVLEIENLAVAIHLTRCQRASGMRNRDLRILTDTMWTLSQILDLSAAKVTELVEQSIVLSGQEPDEKCHSVRQAATEFNRLLANHSDFQTARELARSSQSLKIYPLATGDPRYPVRLKSVDSCPVILYVRGSALVEALARPLWVTVIGTRNPTVYGQRVTGMITRELSARGTVIVSGLARGIDTLAHEIALEQNSPTVAVTGCGLDLAYPPENARLMQKIADQGVLISEHPPKVEPRRQHFPARNRILSGLSDVVAVMEAAQRSGTLITAGFAGDQGRDVFAVPGSILDQASGGCHQLIRDGAKILEQASDIFREYPVRFIQDLLAPQQLNSVKSSDKAAFNHDPGEAFAGGPSLALKQNGSLAMNILQILRSQSLTLDQIAELSGQPIREIITAVSFLELGGQVVCRLGRYALTASGQCSI